MTNTLNALSQQLRREALWAIYQAGSGHPGGSLSCMDILTVLFHDTMRPPTERLESYSDDYFVLSKGHAAPALYAVAASKGLIAKGDVKTLRKIGSALQGHPDVCHLPWVEFSTGSLGQGLSAATGIAKAHKMKQSSRRIYSLIGDGEMQEGQVWEAAMFAAHHKLDNLTVIVDYNKLQSDASNADICGLEPLAQKWQSFGWQVEEVNGHSIEELQVSLNKAKKNQSASPWVIIAHTVKGKGVAFMEGVPAWHGSVAFTKDQINGSLSALGCSDGDIAEYHHE